MKAGLTSGYCNPVNQLFSAFKKAEKYDEIKYLVNERTDLNAYALIERIIDVIGEDKDEV